MVVSCCASLVAVDIEFFSGQIRAAHSSSADRAAQPLVTVPGTTGYGRQRRFLSTSLLMCVGVTCRKREWIAPGGPPNHRQLSLADLFLRLHSSSIRAGRTGDR